MFGLIASAITEFSIKGGGGISHLLKRSFDRQNKKINETISSKYEMLKIAYNTKQSIFL